MPLLTAKGQAEARMAIECTIRAFLLTSWRICYHIYRHDVATGLPVGRLPSPVSSTSRGFFVDLFLVPRLVIA
jgi:hypothetical protein